VLAKGYLAVRADCPDAATVWNWHTQGCLLSVYALWHDSTNSVDAQNLAMSCRIW
jgi:hypothetical protein